MTSRRGEQVARRAKLTALGLVAWAACGSSGHGAPAEPDAPPAPDAVPDALTTVTQTGTVTDSSAGTPIAGATICIGGHPEIACATTDATGTYHMTLPTVTPSPEVAVVVTAAGHLGEAILFQVESFAAFWPGSIALEPDATAASYFTTAGFVYPSSGTGFVLVRVFSTAGGEPGVTATMSPTSGTGPVYADTSGEPDPKLTATTSSGGLLFGNVAPGPFTITVSAPGKTCEPIYANGWLGPGPNAIDGAAVAGAWTYSLNLDCE